MKIVAVIAGTYRQFARYRNDHQEPDVRLIFVDQTDKIRGMTFDEVVKTGTWWMLRDVDEIETHIKRSTHA